MFLLGKPRLRAAALAGLTLFFCFFCGLFTAIPPIAWATPARPEQASAGQQNDLSKQEELLRREVRRTPQDPRAMAKLGAVLAMENKMQESVTWLEKALKLNPSDSDARRTLATNYWQMGQLEKARQNLEQILRAKPQDGWSTLLLGMVCEDLGDHARAARLLTAVLPRTRQRPEPILALARAYYQLNQSAKAREALGYLNDLPDKIEAVFAGGHLAAEFRDYKTAEELFRSIRYTYPNAGEIQFNLALALYSQKQYFESQKTLLAAVESGQASATAYELLGWTYEQQDRMQDMMKAFEKAINMEPGQESHFLELGQALLEKRVSETALDVAREAVKRFPASSRAYSLKGSAELAMSRLTEALESYSKAVDLDPKDAKAATGLALTYWNANQDAKAAAVFGDAAAKFPQDAFVQLKYAVFLINSPEEKTPQQEAQIKGLLRRAEYLDGSMAETHFDLGNIAVKEENYPEAVREFELAKKLDPEMAKVHFALAKVYRRLGKQKEAAEETEIHDQLKAREEEKSEASAGIGTRHQ